MTPEREVRAERAARAARRGVLARGSVLNLAGGAVHGLATFALTVLVARATGAGGAGVFFAAMSVFLITIEALKGGADAGLVRFVAGARAHDDSATVPRLLGVAIVPVVVVALAASVVLTVAAEPLATVLGGEASPAAVADTLRRLAWLLPVGVASLAVLSATQGFGTMIPFNVSDRMLRPGLQLGLVAAAAAAGMEASGLVVVWATAYVVSLAAAVGFLGRLMRGNRAGRGQRQAVGGEWGRIARRFWSFSLPRALAAVMQVGVQRVDVPVVAALASFEVAGLYAVASQLARIGGVVHEGLVRAIAPQAGELAATGQRQEAAHLLQTATVWGTALTWPAYLVLAVFAPTILTVLFGGRYVDAAPAVVLLAVAMLIATGTGPVTMVLLMAGKSSWNLGNTGVSLGLNVGLNLWLVPRYGLIGAAVAWTASIAIENLLPTVELRRWLDISAFSRELGIVALAAFGLFGIGGLAARMLLGGGLPGLALVVGLATPTYLALLVRWRHRLGIPGIREVVVWPRRRAAPVTATPHR